MVRIHMLSCEKCSDARASWLSEKKRKRNKNMKRVWRQFGNLLNPWVCQQCFHSWFFVPRHSLIKRVQPGRLERNDNGFSYILCLSLFLVSVVSFFLKMSPTAYFCIEYRFAQKGECQKQVNIWINLPN